LKASEKDKKNFPKVRFFQVLENIETNKLLSTKLPKKHIISKIINYKLKKSKKGSIFTVVNKSVNDTPDASIKNLIDNINDKHYDVSHNSDNKSLLNNEHSNTTCVYVAHNPKLLGNDEIGTNKRTASFLGNYDGMVIIIIN